MPSYFLVLLDMLDQLLVDIGAFYPRARSSISPRCGAWSRKLGGLEWLAIILLASEVVEEPDMLAFVVMASICYAFFFLEGAAVLVVFVSRWRARARACLEPRP